MPATQAAVRGVYDFDAPAAEGLAIGFKMRANQGGKLNILVENPISSRPATPGFETSGLQQPFTYSIQVAPAQADGTPGTFVDTTAAANLEAVVDVVANPGENNSHTVLVRPGLDAFILVTASGGARGQLQTDRDDIWDLWRTADGKADLTPV